MTGISYTLNYLSGTLESHFCSLFLNSCFKKCWGYPKPSKTIINHQLSSVLPHVAPWWKNEAQKRSDNQRVAPDHRGQPEAVAPPLRRRCWGSPRPMVATGPTHGGNRCWYLPILWVVNRHKLGVSTCIHQYLSRSTNWMGGWPTTSWCFNGIYDGDSMAFNGI